MSVFLYSDVAPSSEYFLSIRVHGIRLEFRAVFSHLAVKFANVLAAKHLPPPSVGEPLTFGPRLQNTLS
jgi:hypothetical protein